MDDAPARPGTAPRTPTIRTTRTIRTVPRARSTRSTLLAMILAAVAPLAGVTALLLPAPAATAAAAGDFGYRDGSFSGAGTAPTADKPQSKLWFNDGSWWADMFAPASGTWHV